jgi:hypothetical protein
MRDRLASNSLVIPGMMPGWLSGQVVARGFVIERVQDRQRDAVGIADHGG